MKTSLDIDSCLEAFFQVFAINQAGSDEKPVLIFKLSEDRIVEISENATPQSLEILRTYWKNSHPMASIIDFCILIHSM